MNEQAYAATGNELADRILALIPSHPEILTMDGPWPLFKIPEFKCNDLDPSLAQAGAALAKARAVYRSSEPSQIKD